MASFVVSVMLMLWSASRSETINVSIPTRASEHLLSGPVCSVVMTSTIGRCFLEVILRPETEKEDEALLSRITEPFASHRAGYCNNWWIKLLQYKSRRR